MRPACPRLLSSFLPSPLILSLMLITATSLIAQPSHTVRIGYIVPSNRTPQPDAVENLQQAMLSIQAFYAEQMDRYGFGGKTFTLEQDALGMPVVHQVTTPLTDSEMRGDFWGYALNSATAAGLGIWHPGEIWVLVPESHSQSPDGSVQGSGALGGSFGSGSDGGVALIGGDALPRLHPSNLTDTRPYAGLTIPGVGPYPLVQDVSFPWFEGNTVSSASSSVQGALAHELGHALGYPHDFRNDSNFKGNLMGNGLRGWRGTSLLDQFPTDYTQLSYSMALGLNSSRYFNPDLVATDNIKPIVVPLTSNLVNTVNGLLQVEFLASDGGGLASAHLIRNGEAIGEMAISGDLFSGTFETPYFSMGGTDRFEIAVYDYEGNKQIISADIGVNIGQERAPIPYIEAFATLVDIGEEVLFSASRSNDPDGFGPMSVEWDLNGDLVFDTLPSANMFFSTTFASAGSYLIRARLTDGEGYSSISAPFALRVMVPEASSLSLGVVAAGIAALGAFLRRKR